MSIVNSDKNIALQKTNEYWREHCVCALRDSATQPVFGAGDPNGGIVFIGEAPGKKEDIQGIPFIGAAGKLLQEMLATLPLTREQVYITNIVKYRPPNNRDPLPQEKIDCAEWLAQELAVIQPKLIVLLGRHALHHFFPDADIGTTHGVIHDGATAAIPMSNTMFLPLYHPAAGIYNRALRPQMLLDIAAIKTVLDLS